MVVVTAEGLEAAQLERGLHTLSDDLHSQIVGESDDRLDDLAITVICPHSADEGPVDLEHIKWQVVQMGEGRVPSAKVIDTELHAQGAEAAQ